MPSLRGPSLLFNTMLDLLYTHSLADTLRPDIGLSLFRTQHNTSLLLHEHNWLEETSHGIGGVSNTRVLCLDVSVILADQSSVNKPYLQIKLNANKPRPDFKRFPTLQPFIALLSEPSWRCLCLCRFLLSLMCGSRRLISVLLLLCLKVRD